MSNVLALTMGDPAGIGPEIIAKAIDSDELSGIAIVVVGVRSIIEEAIHIYSNNWEGEFLDFEPEEEFNEGIRFKWLEEPVGKIIKGKVSAKAGSMALESVRVSSELCLEGKVSGIVTTPVSKEAIELNGISFDGHTGYIANQCGVKGEMMMMSFEDLNVGYVTTHIPLSKVASQLTEELVLERLRLSWEYLMSMSIKPAKIALCGLNPHAGEGGHMGREEIDVLVPALKRARLEGIQCEGPFPSDTIFVERYRKNYGVILALYHDQGGIPFKMLAFDHGVNHTLGLPIIRTSVDHGTAWDIAWQGKASERSLISAIKMAKARVNHKHEHG